MNKRVQLVFCGHTWGQLAHSAEVQPQPPLGLLVLASFLKQALPHIDIEVFDGKHFSEDELAEKLNAPVVGLSVWFSNYEASCSLASRVKRCAPGTTIVMGGPHPTWIGDRILRHQTAVDYVIRGEGEIAFAQLLKGHKPETIPGVLFRRGNGVAEGGYAGSWAERIDLDSLPELDLEVLRPAYRWKSSPSGPAMAAFPISGIRGCQRSRHRCEYCSIPTSGYRFMSPENYWRQIETLHSKYGIDYFFETGDTFAPQILRRVASVRRNLPVRFRIYSYPGTNRDEDIPFLHQMGVSTVFMGVESVLHWQSQSSRRFSPNYTIESLLAEIQTYATSGIQVWPGFLLGLPGEDFQSLHMNLDLIECVSRKPNVPEFTASLAMPLPGTALFESCCKDVAIVSDTAR